MKAKRTVVSNPSSPLAGTSPAAPSPGIKEAIANEAPVVESPQKDKELMGRYLNTDNENFLEDLNSPIYVDKTLLIKETNAFIKAGSYKFMCVTRPRRFGKTMALSMLNAYYSKGCDSRELFKNLAISKDPSFEEHLNKHNVLWIDLGKIYTGVKDPNLFVDEIERRLVAELIRNYPRSRLKGLSLSDAIAKLYLKKGERFIFLIDEWDVIYREEEHNRKLCDKYTKFLRDLFKSTDVHKCFDLVYMTGILPIRRYNTQSTLNMFTEYNMLDPRHLASYFGFTEDEVKALCEKRGADFAEIKNWYDGYRLNGFEIYNPKSVVEAVFSGSCKDYWVATSATEAITDYMNFDKGALKQTIAEMLTGKKTKLDATEFGNDLTKVDSQDAALCVLIHLGYLAYDADSKSCYIPNHEIAVEFKRAAKKLKWKPVFLPMQKSDELYDETFKGNASFIDEAMDENHRDIANLFNRNKEDILGVVVYLSYFSSREHYEVRKEETSTLGRADLSFVPFEAGYDPFIVELKIGKSPDEAIAQIKEKQYWKAWPRHKGKVLLVGITYDSKTLKHASKVEWIDVD